MKIISFLVVFFLSLISKFTANGGTIPRGGDEGTTEDEKSLRLRRNRNIVRKSNSNENVKTPSAAKKESTKQRRLKKNSPKYPVAPPIEDRNEEDPNALLECSNERPTFVGTVFVRFQGSPELLSQSEIDALLEEFKASYNDLTYQGCDIYFRTISNVTFSLPERGRGPGRDLQTAPTVQGALFTYVGTCKSRNCPTSAWEIDDNELGYRRLDRFLAAKSGKFSPATLPLIPKRNLQGDNLEEFENNGVCECPASANSDTFEPTPPSIDAFVSVYNDGITQLVEEGFVTNVQGVTGMIEIIDNPNFNIECTDENDISTLRCNDAMCLGCEEEVTSHCYSTPDFGLFGEPSLVGIQKPLIGPLYSVEIVVQYDQNPDDVIWGIRHFYEGKSENSPAYYMSTIYEAPLGCSPGQSDSVKLFVPSGFFTFYIENQNGCSCGIEAGAIHIKDGKDVINVSTDTGWIDNTYFENFHID